MHNMHSPCDIKGISLVGRVKIMPHSLHAAQLQDRPSPLLPQRKCGLFSVHWDRLAAHWPPLCTLRSRASLAVHVALQGLVIVLISGLSLAAAQALPPLGHLDCCDKQAGRGQEGL